MAPVSQSPSDLRPCYRFFQNQGTPSGDLISPQKPGSHQPLGVYTIGMKSRVFLSCGQQPKERDVARKLAALLRTYGFEVYIAINAQTILEINAGIIGELKNSDCYLFVNFCRDKIAGKYRGSLFSNQELAIAYAFGFERILIVNQTDILSEGMLQYIGVNTETFEDFTDCCTVVERAIRRSGWMADYSRRLRAGGLRFSDEVIRYGAAYGELIGRFLYLDIQNGRPDIAALEATAKLAEYGPMGEPLRPSPIRSPLKTTGRPGFSHTIFPNSHEAFDLLCIGEHRAPGLGWPPAVGGSTIAAPLAFQNRGVHLNSAYDVIGAGRLPMNAGVWMLRYEFYAIGFPLLSVLVRLNVTDWEQPAAKLVSQEAA